MSRRRIVTSKAAERMLCAMQPSNECCGEKCMAWMEETELVGMEPVKDPLRPPAGIYKPTGKGYCGMVKG